MRHAGRAVAALADGAVVLGFVVSGRRSHAEGVDVAGTAATVWPFLAALAIGWTASRAWRGPASLRRGAVVWAVTVAGGLALRRLGGGGTPVSFALVTTGVLAAGLLGWRAVVAGAALAPRGGVRGTDPSP